MNARAAALRREARDQAASAPPDALRWGVRWVLAACALAGCGRYAFDRSPDARAAGSDAAQPHDAAPHDADDATVMPDAFDETAACAGFALCDSFEGSGFSPVWTADTGLTLDSTHAHRGLQSVHAHVPALATGVTGFSQLDETRTLGGASVPPTFYVRAWLFLSALPAGNNRMEAISVVSATPSSIGDYTFIHSNDTVIYTQADTQNALAGVPPPTNTWFCVVFRVTRGTSSNGSLAFTSDVLPSLTLPGCTTDSNATPIQHIGLGIGFAGTNVFNPQPALDLWLDDVIVDTQPLTCAD